MLNIGIVKKVLPIWLHESFPKESTDMLGDIYSIMGKEMRRCRKSILMDGKQYHVLVVENGV